MIFIDLIAKTVTYGSLSGAVSQIHLMIFFDLIVKTVTNASLSGSATKHNLMELPFCSFGLNSSFGALTDDVQDLIAPRPTKSKQSTMGGVSRDMFCFVLRFPPTYAS
jgi:hypothetical protein